MSLDVPKGIAYPRLLLLWQILRDGMGSRWEPDRIVAVVKLYLDDSGTDPQTPSILMGGLVARPRQWRRCEKEAEQLLSALGIETLHAKEFHNCTGPFEGWTHQQKLDLAGQIGACWQRNKVVGCFLAAHKENYGLARGARTDLPAAVSQCMALLVQHLMEDGVVRGFIEKDGLSILVERGNRNSGGMQKIHDEVLVPTYGDLLRSFSFVPKTDSRAIQTADFLAFHVRRHMDAQMKANKGLRFGDVLRKLRQPDPNVKPLRFIGNFLEDLRFSPA